MAAAFRLLTVDRVLAARRTQEAANSARAALEIYIRTGDRLWTAQAHALLAQLRPAHPRAT